ncbi:hypothetical protein HYV85_03310 [Candidatus Woesearchaeota archaeon]|nr:hypothetical protein [Candidatus Woesearchaeota archaeon]
MVSMGLFDFGKKKEEPLRQPRVPVDEVLRMRAQGLSSNQIVQALQRNGYQTHQIFDALSQSDLRVPAAMQGMQGVPGQRQQQPTQGMQAMQGAQGESPTPGTGAGTLGMPPDLPPIGEGGEGMENENEASITGPQSPEELAGFGEEGLMPESNRGSEGGEGFGAVASPQSYGGYGGQNVSAKVEEISEAIIEEKWQDLMKDFNKLVEWKSGVEQRMSVLEQRFSDMKTAFDNLQKGVVDKVSDYDKSVKDVGSEMKALEQVFQKIIPTLTENVNELSRITKGMKTAPKK